MCAMLDLNRMTLRNALERLSDFGVIESRVGQGTFVAQPKMTRDLQDTIGFSEAARNEGRTPSYRLVYAQMCEANKDMVKHLHVMLASPVFALRRVNQIDGIPVSLETTYVNARLCPGIDAHDFSHESLYHVLEEEYGVIPASGSESIDITRVDETEAELLGVRVGKAAFYQSGLILDAEGQPVEFFRSVVLSDHLRFSTQLQRVRQEKVDE